MASVYARRVVMCRICFCYKFTLENHRPTILFTFSRNVKQGLRHIQVILGVKIKSGREGPGFLFRLQNLYFVP